MRIDGARRRFVWWTCCAVMLSACGGETPADGGPPADAAPPAPDSALPDVPQPDTGPPTPEAALSLDAVTPAWGPARGGSVATLRGGGFEEGASSVTFGDVAAMSIMFIDAHRIEVVVPPGSVGPVDVVIMQGDERESLTAGFRYDALAVDPPMGSVAGGTHVSIETLGIAFASGDRVSFDGTPCLEVAVASPSRITCKTPPGTIGLASLTVEHASGGVTEAPDAFRYLDPVVASGGLAGGPIEGAIDVVVLDSPRGSPVENAFVIVGEDLTTPLQGRTNADGRVTLSGPGLTGPVNLHIAKSCFETTSFVGFDARRVTAFVVSHTTAGCFPPVPGAARYPNGAFVEGELVWPGGPGPQPWVNVPEPRAGDVRVAYLLTTSACRACRNPDPRTGGAVQRVLEAPTGTAGYPYRIYSRAGGVAVYALAGLQDETTGVFRPFAMGIARGLALAPSEERRGVDLAMDIPLDRAVEVVLSDLPEVSSPGPDNFVVRARPVIGEGWINLPRQPWGSSVLPADGPFDTMRSRTETTFRFALAPPLEGALVDARWDVDVVWETTGTPGGQPSSRRILRDARATGAPIEIDDLLSTPTAVAPADGEPLPGDRTLSWSMAGSPEFWVVAMLGSDGNPAWRAFLHGERRALPVPDLGSIDGVNDIPPGLLSWATFGFRTGGMSFDEFTYGRLNAENTATHLSSANFRSQR